MLQPQLELPAGRLPRGTMRTMPCTGLYWRARRPHTPPGRPAPPRLAPPRATPPYPVPSACPLGPFPVKRVPLCPGPHRRVSSSPPVPCPPPATPAGIQVVVNSRPVQSTGIRQSVAPPSAAGHHCTAHTCTCPQAHVHEPTPHHPPKLPSLTRPLSTPSQVQAYGVVKTTHPASPPRAR